MVGGALARPCISYPDIFPPGTIWERFPYLLPNLFSAITVFVGVIVGILFLEETHVAKRHRRDRGRELGDYLTSKLPSWSDLMCRRGRAPEKKSLLRSDMAPDDDSEDDILPEYRNEGDSPRLAPQDDAELVAESIQPHEVPSLPAPAAKTFTRPVIMNIISYGILAL